MSQRGRVYLRVSELDKELSSPTAVRRWRGEDEA